MDDDKKQIKSKTVSSLFWRFMERCGAQVVTFVVSIILARLLDPDIYGVIALVTVFTSIMQVFVDSGLGNALIQKKNADDIDFSTVFYFNIVVCCLLYIVMFLIAPWIANFYNNTELILIIRILSITLLISGVRNVQQAYVSRNLLFKKFFFSTIGGTIGAAIVGIGMAYAGYGVWALVAQQLFNVFVGTVILWFTVKWRPKFIFSIQRLKVLFSFGWKLLVSSLLETIYNDLRQIIIGKIYSSNDLAFYNKGRQFPQLIASNVTTSIDSVLLSTMSKEQDNRERVKMMTRRAIKTSVYVMAPIMIGLAACAVPFVKALLTDKWLDCVLYLRIFSITYIFFPIHTSNLNAIKAMGRSDMFLKLEIVKKVIGLFLVLVTMFISVEAMACSMLLGTIINTIVNSYPNKKLLNYSWFEQMKDFLPAIGLSVLMGIPVLLMQYIPIPTIFILILQFFTGVILYIMLSVIFKFETFYYLVSILTEILKKKSNR